MQKAHSRINWENLPSINTSLGANNLNKMDKALDVIDDRVLSLYGYEGRVAQSEKNAKESETNAKTSETNAKQSELLAKEYMENAFSGTPDGYDKLVEDVRLMDIQTTTDTTLLNSKAGGYKLLSMIGKSVQNGTPNPDYPQSLNHTGDCVEMMQGYYYYADGTYKSHTMRVCNVRSIKCNSGDTIQIACEGEKIITIVYYSDSGFLSCPAPQTGIFNGNVPSGATSFNFYVEDTVAITPDTVGKILLIINDKYVVQIVEHEKNFSKNNNVTGTGSVAIPEFIPKGTYTISCECTTTDTDHQTSRIAFTYVNGGGTNGYVSRGERTSTIVTLEDDVYLLTFFAATSSSASTGDTFTFANIQIEQGEIATEFEEYKEKVATVLLDAPLCETDVMSRTEVNRKRASVVYDGSDDESWVYDSTYNCFRISVPNGFKSPSSSKTNFLCSHYTPIPRGATWADYENWISATSSLFYVYAGETTTTTDWKAKLQTNPFTVEYVLAEEVIETLDTDSQIALNSLETFDTVTYINVDSRVQPSEIKGEYGTSIVGARTIKNELRNDTLEIKYNELAVALVATESGV